MLYLIGCSILAFLCVSKQLSIHKATVHVRSYTNLSKYKIGLRLVDLKRNNEQNTQARRLTCFKSSD